MEGRVQVVHWATASWPGVLPKVGVTFWGHEGISQSEHDMQLQTGEGFLLGVKHSPGMCFRGPQSGGFGGQGSVPGRLISQTRVRVRAKGHGRADLTELSMASQKAE